MKKAIKNSLVYFTLISFSTFSCKKKFDSKTKMLSSNNKLWQLDKPFENQRGVFTYYRFTVEGKWKVYRKNKESKLHEKLDTGDVELIESWAFMNDSTINVGGLNYKIITLNEATLSYVNPIDKDTLKMFFKGDKLHN